MRLFSGLMNIFSKKREPSAYELYLSQAKDLFDLERREYEWKRGKRV